MCSTQAAGQDEPNRDELAVPSDERHMRTCETDSLGVDPAPVNVPAPVSAKGDTAVLPPPALPAKPLRAAGAGAFQILPPAAAADVGGPLPNGESGGLT